MTTRVQMVAPALTPGARSGLVGADEPLDARGRAAAERLAGTWATSAVATCAPSAQCRETASLAGLDARPDEMIRDWALGSWVGTSLAELAGGRPRDLARWSSDPDFGGHGGESLRRLLARAAGWLDRIEQEGPGPLLAVTHAAFIRAVLVSVLDAPPEAFWRLDVEPLASVHLTLRPERRAVRWPGG